MILSLRELILYLGRVARDDRQIDFAFNSRVDNTADLAVDLAAHKSVDTDATAVISALDLLGHRERGLVDDLLTEQKYLRENPDKKGQSPESPNSTLSELITAGAESLHAVSEELPLTRLCDEILTQLGVSADNKLVFKEIKGWLMNENYLTEAAENGKTRLATTILSDEAGIVEREKISSLNRSYKTVLFPKEAQEFIFENLGEIFGNS